MAKPCPPHPAAVRGHPDVVVVDERVRALALRLAARPMLRTMSMPGVPAGTRNMDMPWYALTSGFGHRHHDEKRGRPGVGREELPAVQDPPTRPPRFPFSAPLPFMRTARVANFVGSSRPAARSSSSRRTARRRAAAAGTVPSARACRSGRGSRRCPCPGAWEPKSDRRPARAAEDLVHQAEFQLAVALPSESGPRCVAHSSSSRTACLSGSVTVRSLSPSGVNTRSGQSRSSGSTSSRTNASAKSSLA